MIFADINVIAVSSSVCHTIMQEYGVEYGHVRGDTDQQKRLVEEYVVRLKWREECLEES